MRTVEGTNQVLLLGRATIAECFTLDDCIRAVESAFGAHAHGKSIQPGLLHIDAGVGEFHIKAGGLACARRYFACKVNGGFFGNQAAHGLPNIIGLIVLCDGSTGIPLAVMESGLITRLRTGAATAVAAKYLARPASETVTICGAGAQSDLQARALARVLRIKRVNLWSRRPAPLLAERLARELEIDVRPTTDLAKATRASDIVVTCTPAKQWFLGRDHISPGTLIVALGCDSPKKQEIEPELLASNSVVPDLLVQALQAGDLRHAVERGLMKPQDIRGELGAVVIGTAPGRMNDSEVIVFDSTGTALQDVAASASVFERAALAGAGTPFAFWSEYSPTER